MSTSTIVDPLSDDDLGHVNAMAAALPSDIDLRDEPAMLRALHAARFEAGAIARLAPLVTERVRELRAWFGPWDAGAPIALDAAQFDAARWRAAEEMRRRNEYAAARLHRLGAR